MCDTDTGSETVNIARGELTASEILQELSAGNRVVIEAELLGRTLRMSIRERGGTYYCDTPVKLLTFDSDDGLRNCLERYKLAGSGTDGEDADETDTETDAENGTDRST